MQYNNGGQPHIPPPELDKSLTSNLYKNENKLHYQVSEDGRRSHQHLHIRIHKERDRVHVQQAHEEFQEGYSLLCRGHQHGILKGDLLRNIRDVRDRILDRKSLSPTGEGLPSP